PARLRSRCSSLGGSPLLRVNPFHLSDGAGKIGACLIEAVQRGDLVVVGAGQGVLRLNDFDVVGHAGLEAVAGLIDFRPGGLPAEVGDLHLVARGLQVEQSGLDVQGNLIAQIGFLLVQNLQLQIGFGDFGAGAAAGENGHVDGGLVVVGGDAVVQVVALVIPV